jgi:hypothetical protein
MARSSQQIELAQIKLSNVLEALLLKGPLIASQIERDKKFGCGMSHGTVINCLRTLLKEEYIRIFRKSKYRGAVLSTRYQILRAGTLFVFLRHARKNEIQSDLLQIQKEKDSDNLDFEDSASIPCLFPRDRIWSDLVGLIKNQNDTSNGKGDAAWPIPYNSLKFFKDKSELMRAIMLLNMYHYRGTLFHPLEVTIQRHRLRSVGETGLDEWSRSRIVPNFLLGLLSAAKSTGHVFTSTLYGQMYSQGEFIYPFLSYLRRAREGNKREIERDLELLESEVRNYMTCDRRIVKIMKQSLHDESMYVGFRQHTIEKLKEDPDLS